MTHISRSEVEHIAMLARLQLTDEELEGFTAELDEILAYADQIAQLNVDDVEPTFHAVKQVNVLRAGDEVGQQLPVDDALANAPDTRPPFYQVPKVADV